MTGQKEDEATRFAPAMGDGPSGAEARHQPRFPAGNLPQNSRGHVVIFLPALNEEAAIGGVLERIPKAQLEAAGYNVSVWVVDGNSTDGTLQVVRARGASVFVQRGRGKGSGMRQAFNHLLTARELADGGSRDPEFFLMLDADGTYPPEAVPQFLEALVGGSDVVLGSRFRGHIAPGAMTPLNAFGNRILSTVARLLYGVRVTDVCTGMWGFNAEALRQISLEAGGFDLEADMFGAACRAKARISELPIDYAPRTGPSRLLPFRSGLYIAWRLLARRLKSQYAEAAPEETRYESPERAAA